MSNELTIEEKMREAVKDNIKSNNKLYQKLQEIESPKVNDFMDLALRRIPFDLLAKTAEAHIPQWVKVSDRLPELYDGENSNRVLCIVKHKGLTYYEVCTLHKFGDKMLWSSNSVHDINVTHWMPLPHPPKEDNNG